MCLVCGLKNPYGLHASYYELDNGDLVCVFRPREHHQSYPGRTHGGITAAVLDETIGRAVMHARDLPTWGVTVEFSIKYRKPIPYDQDLRAVGRITSDSGRIFEGTGELLLADGTIAAEAVGKYLKMPIDKIADFDADAQEWRVYGGPEDPTEIQI
jgi:acyl-coenzyme A thioesterase PaaI-like protein